MCHKDMIRRAMKGAVFQSFLRPCSAVQTHMDRTGFGEKSIAFKSY